MTYRESGKPVNGCATVTNEFNNVLKIQQQIFKNCSYNMIISTPPQNSPCSRTITTSVFSGSYSHFTTNISLYQNKTLSSQTVMTWRGCKSISRWSMRQSGTGDPCVALSIPQPPIISLFIATSKWFPPEWELLLGLWAGSTPYPTQPLQGSKEGPLPP